MARRIVLLIGSAAALTLGIASQAGAYVYWTNWDGSGTDVSIGRANTNGSSPNEHFITGPPSSEPNGLATNDGFIYWANEGTDAIVRANLNGTGVNNAFIGSAPSASGLAINATSIFWTQAGDSHLGTANLNGSSPNHDLITDASTPNGLAVSGAHIYWGNLGTNQVGISDLDGGNEDLTFIQGSPTISGISGIAVDAQHIYWANFNNDTIGRADLPDGDNAISNFVSGANNPCAVAVSGSHLYWANFGNSSNGSIGRADIASGSAANVNQNFITAAKGPCGVTTDRFPIGTTTSVSCSPHAVGITQPTTCTAKVSGSSGSTPTGTVSFTSTGGSFGSGGACTLAPVSAAQGSCSLSYSRSDAATAPIAAAYGGDFKNGAGKAAADVKVGTLTLGAATKNKKKGTASLTANVPGAGTLALSGKGLKAATVQVASDGDVTLLLKAKGKSAKKLRKNGKAKINPLVTFTPSSGNPETASAKVKLVKRVKR